MQRREFLFEWIKEYMYLGNHYSTVYRELKRSKYW